MEVVVFIIGILMGSFFVLIGLQISIDKIKIVIECKYLVIEMLTGILYMFIYLKFHSFNWEFYLGICFISVLIIIIVSDLEYMIIYNWVIIGGGIPIIIIKFINNSLIHNLNSIFTMFFVTILFVLLYYIFMKIYNIEAIGGGDIKLYMIISVMLNFNLTLLSLFIASLIGIIFNFNNKSPFAFGPYIVAGSIVSYFYGDIIFKIVFQI